jgi:hypothetical protein
MAGTLRTATIGSIAPGLNNRRPDFKLDHVTNDKKDTFVRAAVNTDITTEGTAKRRRGFASLFAGAGCHSLWGNLAGTAMYFVDNGVLKEVRGSRDDPVVTVLRSDMGNVPVSYTDADDGNVYYTNGTLLRRLDDTGDHAAGIAPLAMPPTLQASTGGALSAGRYQMVATLVDAKGEESGSTAVQQIEAADGGVITVGALPATWPDGAVKLRIYLTSTNGTTLLRARELVAPLTTVTFSTMPNLGARCPTLLLAPMVAGQIVRMCNGRMLVVAGSMLIYSEPFAFTLRNPSKNYIPFPAQITMLEVCPLGFYIAADHTYWVDADLANLKPVLFYGAIPRTGAAVPNTKDVWWMSERGRVLGSDNGEVKVLEEPNVIVPVAQSGASLFRESDGMKQALTSLFGLETDRMSAGSYMTAEVIRKGTIL